ncbi:glutathione binding-like protein [Roseofilum sp. BLCC_M114]|uniref:Glutathione binding-like protein n=1 Tax=Roseofilum capinflatum BLCC-M114 TaxID=3022440 RepID=A0ABT7B684_9CYAN|nr:glutathione binding-like protein [Roseofilum capinflatum BLCC-M114]
MKPNKKGGHKALCVMEQQLSKSDFLVNGSLTIADISLYAYTHVADEGGFDLSEYPAVRAWMDRISTHPRHLTLS